MGFFTKLLNKIRGIITANKPINNFVFGSIISGTYSNFKHDPHPTIFYFGTFNKNGKVLIHGIQMHALGNNLSWFLSTISSIKLNGVITNPMLFYNYLKIKNPQLIKDCYRTYHAQFSDFKTISPGISNILPQNCYPISDSRDSFINQLNGTKQIPTQINPTVLKNSITQVISNTVKVW